MTSDLSPSAVSLIPIATLDAGLVREMALRIWPLAYEGIISPGQISYMLESMYSEETLLREIGSEGIAYHWIRLPEEMVGFLAAGPIKANLPCHLYKFYLLPEAQGRGIGRAALSAMIALVTSAGVGVLKLRVNRHNIRAIALYQKVGFEIYEENCREIGGGYVMDDYLMRRPADPR